MSFYRIMGYNEDCGIKICLIKLILLDSRIFIFFYF